MKKVKCSLIMMMFYITLLSFSLCSAQESALIDKPDAMFYKGYDNLLQMDKMHMNMDIKAEIKFRDKKMNMSMITDGDMKLTPILAKCKTKMSFAAEGMQPKEMNILLYMQETDQDIVVYSYEDNKWVKQLAPKYNYDYMKDYKNFFKSIKSVVKLQEDSDSIVYEVTIDGNSLQENYKHIFESMNNPALKISDNIFDGIGDIKYTATIDKKRAVLSGVEIDLSDQVQIIIGNIMKNIKVSGQQADNMQAFMKELRFNITMKMSVSEFNKAEKLVIPAEALSAPVRKAPGFGGTGAAT